MSSDLAGGGAAGISSAASMAQGRSGLCKVIKAPAPMPVHSRGKGHLPETPERGLGRFRQDGEAGAGRQGGAWMMEEAPQAPLGPHEQLLGLAKGPLPLV